MRSTLHRAAAFAAYQLSLIVGILLLPMALAMRKVGVKLPVHRVVDRTSEAYEQVESSSA